MSAEQNMEQMIEQYIDQMKEERVMKDEFFKDNYQSPIPEEERKSFKNLNYYEPNADYHFELELEEFEKKEILKIKDSQGNIRDFLKWGRFTFTVNDQECILNAYKSDENESGLFVPFKDMTSGKTTYGAGRYIDLEEENDKFENEWVLDFNYATNPWCAYSNNFACPLIPAENILKVEILAGEKSYH